MRIRSPGRSLSCTHIQCFDLQFFIQMNEKKPTWLCPVCDKKIPFDTLVIDGLFTEILASQAASITNEIQFIRNNNTIEWSPIVKEEKKPKIEPQDNSDQITSSCGDKRKSDTETSTNSGSKRKKPEPEIITIDSDDDDDDDDEEDDPTVQGRTASNFNQPPVVETFNLSDEEDLSFNVPVPQDPFAIFQTAVMRGLNESNASNASLTSGQKRPTTNPMFLPGSSYGSRLQTDNSIGGNNATNEQSSSHSNYSIESLSTSSRRLMPPLNQYEDDDDIAIIE